MNTADFMNAKQSVSTNPIQIIDNSRLDLIKWFRQLDFKVGAEIGVAHGELSKLICEINPQVKLIAVDAWASYDEYGDYKLSKTFEYMENHYRETMRNYIKRGRCEIIKKFSMDALADVPDESLDFVFIDANHQMPFVKDDIDGWAKKVRPGGIVSGHDYVRIKRVKWGVKEAIQGHVKENNIENWYVIGRDETLPNEVREGARSWMYVKS